MGETEKAAAEAAVVPPPPQQPAALPLGPQPGVKYPIQESHFMVSRPVVLNGSSLFSFCASEFRVSAVMVHERLVGSVLCIDPYHFGKLDPDPDPSEKVESL
jgi:hypothetical protein